MALISLPETFSIPFVDRKRVPFWGLGIMVAIVFFGWLFRGVNLGVDFRGGLVVEAQLGTPQNIPSLRKDLSRALGREVSLQELGKDQKTVLLRTEIMESTPIFLEKIKTVLGEDVEYRRVESIGPKVGRELILNGCIAIFWALAGIMAYVWIRFEWQFSLCALVALLHDCLGLLAFFMLFQLEFNEGAVVAILITASYSINDTVVIFDRLRENLRSMGGRSFVELLNISLNETLSRTILTSSTALLALTMMYFFGGEVISAFSLPILVGIFIGAYSSVVIAVPLLRWLPMPKKGY